MINTYNAMVSGWLPFGGTDEEEERQRMTAEDMRAYDSFEDIGIAIGGLYKMADDASYEKLVEIDEESRDAVRDMLSDYQEDGGHIHMQEEAAEVVGSHARQFASVRDQLIDYVWGERGEKASFYADALRYAMDSDIIEVYDEEIRNVSWGPYNVEKAHTLLDSVDRAVFMDDPERLQPGIRKDGVEMYLGVLDDIHEDIQAFYDDAAEGQVVADFPDQGLLAPHVSLSLLENGDDEIVKGYRDRIEGLVYDIGRGFQDLAEELLPGEIEMRPQDETVNEKIEAVPVAGASYDREPRIARDIGLNLSSLLEKPGTGYGVQDRGEKW